MISQNKKYTCFSPSKTKTGKTYFKVSDWNKNAPTIKKYITVFCENDIELTDKCKVIINSISGVGVSEYNGKDQVSMFASVSLDIDEELANMAGNTQTEIDPSDLPF